MQSESKIHPFKNNTNGENKTPTEDSNILDELNDECKCGDEKCINGVKHRCMPDPNGKCIWFKTNEPC